MTATQARADVLAQPIAGLQEALQKDYPGHEREWADAAGGALAGVHQALRLHAAATEGSDGLLAKLDLTRPTLARQAAAIRREHTQLCDRAHNLESQLMTAAEAFQSSHDSPHARPLPEPTPVTTIPDFGTLREDAQKLLTALQQHVAEEAKLILESVNTDIGVGD